MSGLDQVRVADSKIVGDAQHLGQMGADGLSA